MTTEHFMSIAEKSGGKDQGRFNAMHASRRLSEELVVQYPQIADDYRAGLNQYQITKKYHLEALGHTLSVVRSAISYALIHLIPDESERQDLASRMQSKNASLLPIDRREIGRRVRDRKVGIHAMTTEQRKEAGRLSTMACGNIPWEGYLHEIQTGLDEIGHFRMLLGHPRFQFRQFGDHGKPCNDLDAMANELNRVFHWGKPIRTVGSLQHVRARLKSV